MVLDVHTHKPLPGSVCSIEPGQPMEKNLLYSLGLHPWHLGAESDFNKVEVLSGDRNVVAIGETGIDRVCGVDLTLQADMLEKHILLSERTGKPLVLHSVRSAQDIIEMHRKFSPCQPWMVHGFRGKPTTAAALSNEGIYISLGEHFNPSTPGVIPPDLLLAETDDSDLSIKEIVRKIADSLNMDSAKLTDILEKNASEFFSIGE